MKKLIEAFGWYGMIAIMGAYVLVSFSIIKATSIGYQVLNVTGALGIVAVALSKKDYQPAVLNLIWAIVAFVSIIRILVG